VNLPEAGTTARTYRPERLLASTAKTSVLEVQPASVTAFDECPDEMLVRPLRVNSARPSTRSARTVGSPADDGWLLHDYLEMNPSREKVMATRRADSDRKRNGNQLDSNGIPNGIQTDPPRAHARRSGKGTGKVSENKDSDSARDEGSPTVEQSMEDFAAWLAHHAQVTGLSPPKAGTQARAHIAAMFGARQTEGYSLDDLKYATVGAFTDRHRRENGYFGCESVLRPTKIHDLIEKGRRHMAGQRTSDSAEATKRRLAEGDL